MLVQWCIKGIRAADPANGGEGIDADQARDILEDGRGIVCNRWRNKPDRVLSNAEIQQSLTRTNLDLHVNNYNAIATNTPFISLASGCVERDVFAETNHILPARDTALAFATSHGAHAGFLFFCWVIVGPKQAVGVEAVAEEVRNLNVYKSWSPWQLEGEVTAKIKIPANQIAKYEFWKPTGSGLELSEPEPGRPSVHWNPRFAHPEQVSNVRGFF